MVLKKIQYTSNVELTMNIAVTLTCTKCLFGNNGMRLFIWYGGK